MKKSLLVLLTLFYGVSNAQNPMPVPPLLTGPVFNLQVQNGTRVFYPGFSTNTMGMNGDYLGPTLKMTKGDFVTLNVSNTLTDSTTIHWHGMHVPAKADGGPHIVIPPGTTWSPSFEVMDYASTHWYHPHLHMLTADHVTYGVAGFVIVSDSAEAALNLPRTYGVDDFPIALQTRAFDSNKQFIVESALDSVFVINGVMNPYLDLPANVVRLRLLNGATERAFNVGFSNNQNFSMIGSDGGLLSAPVTMNRILIAPGERAEILVDLSALQGQTIFLMNYGSGIPQGIYGALLPQAAGTNIIPNYTLNTINGTDRNMLQINVAAPLPNGVTSTPQSLVTVIPHSPAAAAKTRTFTFMPQVMGPTGSLLGPFVINMMPFDMMMINDTVILNDIEIWELTNQSRISHPFHIHDVHFFILDINGVPPPAHLAGRKDVVLVPPQMGTVRFIAHFTNYADSVTPYMYHCHMLTHEDDGMMGQFLVIDTTSVTGLEEVQFTDVFSVSPNPVQNGIVYLNWKNEVQGNLVVELIDLSGKVVHVNEISVNSEKRTSFHVEGIETGMYFLRIRNHAGYNQTIKLIVSKT